tara:strand:- start:340 stop:1194 length:855 start_codon:yes stop_codon:yes gene_type:complete
MGDENNNSQQELKIHMDSLFDFSSRVPYQKSHLISTLQAAKSLIGINPKKPPKQMLKWIESYISKYSDDIDNKNQEINPKKLEVVTIKEFAKLITQNEKLLALDYVKQLYLVASPQYLAEYILELSLNKSASHALFCWYIYKSLKNIKDEGKLYFIELGVNSLFDNDLEIKNADFIILCLFREILDTIYIRYSTVHPILMKLLLSLKLKCEKEESYYLEREIGPFIQCDREFGLLSFLAALKKDEHSSEMIIQLDAIRSLMKYSSNDKCFAYKEIINNSLKYNA